MIKLDAFATPDEELWLNRSANFYMALAQRDFNNTYQKEHPGVPIMWAGTAAYLIKYPQYRGSGQGQVNTMQYVYYLNRFAKVEPLDLLHTSRLFVALAITISMSIAYLYTRRITGLLPAFIGFLLAAFDPFFLGLTRLLHLDGLLSALMVLSLVSFIAYFETKRLSALVISGLAAGLCWLTKSPGFVLGVAIFIITLLRSGAGLRTKGEVSLVKYMWNSLYPLAAWAGIGVLVYFIFWPAMWVNPLETLTKVLMEAESYAEKGHFTSIYFNGNVIESGDLGWRYAYFYPLTYLWRATPVVLTGLVFAAWGFFTKNAPFERPSRRFFVISLLITAILFTLLMTIGLKKADRYLSPVYPILDMIAGMGIASLVFWLWKRNNRSIAQIGAVLLACSAIGIQLLAVINTYPYYLTFYNPLLGGARQAPNVMQIGWGEGVDQAARYLNGKPDAEKLNVYAWYSGGPFSYFFKGNAFYLAPLLGEREGEMEKFLAADYAVIYIHQWQRSLPKAVLAYLQELRPEKTIWINSLPYVQIYRLP
jgi:hypothetical protein